MESATIERLSSESRIHKIVVYTTLFDFMSDVYQRYYPGFVDWYIAKLVPGFERGERIVYVIRNEDRICGVSILRVSRRFSHNKLCSFFLLPELRKNGMGIELMKRSMRELNIYMKPILVTVPEERAGERLGQGTLLDFFELYGFGIAQKLSGVYRQGKYEYFLVAQPDLSLICNSGISGGIERRELISKQCYRGQVGELTALPIGIEISPLLR